MTDNEDYIAATKNKKNYYGVRVENVKVFNMVFKEGDRFKTNWGIVTHRRKNAKDKTLSVSFDKLLE